MLLGEVVKREVCWSRESVRPGERRCEAGTLYTFRWRGGGAKRALYGAISAPGRKESFE